MDKRFKEQLLKYFNTELDQWELFKMESADGPVYISFSRECIYGEPRSYDDLEVDPD